MLRLPLTIAIILLYLAPATATNSAILFDDAVAYSTGGYNRAIVSADFDGDGDIDLATAQTATCQAYAAILGNNGDGLFPSVTLLTVFGPNPPVCLDVADFDNDGDPDLAAGVQEDIGEPVLWGDIYVSKNLGELDFQQCYETACWGVCPGRMCHADFDGDGDIDVAVTEVEFNTITFCENTGAGSLTYGGAKTVGPASDLCTDYLDGNAGYDIALVDYQADCLRILFGNGGFPSHLDFECEVGDGPTSVRSGDLDGDGHVDLCVANSLGNSVSVLFGAGDGTFSDHTEYPAGDAPGYILPVDLDGDGDQDLAVTNPDLDQISILENTGDRTFGSPTHYPVGDQPVWICSADVDGDGDFDLAVANRSSEDVSVLINLSSVQTDIGDVSGGDALPNRTRLSQNYPNPFNPGTVVEFALPRRSAVSVSIYNIRGQLVRTLLDTELPAGNHEIEWDGCDNSGEPAATGIYLCRLTTPQFSESKKMILLK